MQELNKIIKLKKPNPLCLASRNSSLVELRVSYILLYKIMQGEYKMVDSGIALSIPLTEISAFLGDDKNIYSTIKKIADEMTTRNMYYKIPETGGFYYINPYQTAGIDTNDAGMQEFNILFTPIYSKALLEMMSGKYTLLPKETMLSFKSQYGYRLYEILKSNCYYRKDYKDKKTYKFCITVSLAELRFQLGTVAMREDELKDILQKTGSYEEALKKASKITAPDWRKFRSDVLDSAIKDINATASDMNVTYTTKKGAHAAVKEIIFTCKCKKPETKPEEEPQNEDVKEVVDLLKIFPADSFTEEMSVEKTAECLLNVADGDVERIKAEIEAIDDVAKIKIPVRWLSSAIKNQYSQTKAPKDGTDKKTVKAKPVKTSFHNFEERQYDMDAMEKMLLGANLKKQQRKTESDGDEK